MESSIHTVTIAIPVYNEAEYIQSVISGFLRQNYPGLLEILVADGGSRDGTQDIVTQIIKTNPEVKLLHNPQKIQSYALNIMLRKARGDIFIRADAHCEYAEDYIEKCVTTLVKTDALNVGGAQRFIAKTPFQAGVALASRSLLGNGGAKYRDPNYNGFADTVFMGCFWREALLEVSGYSVDAITNQDAELNLRLLQKKPQGIYVSSEIKVYYYPRKSSKTLWNQYFKYGRGRYITSRRHPQKSPLRTKLPAIGLPFFILVGLFMLKFGIVYTLLLYSFLLSIFWVESIRLTWWYREKFSKIFWRGSDQAIPHPVVRCFNCWIALIIMPIAYTAGGYFQQIRHQVLRVSGW